VWSYEHSLETTAAPERIWQTWADVPGWASWNPDIEQVSIEGPFAVGSEIAMDAVRLRLTDVRENERFVDEALVGESTVRTLHRLDRLGDGRVRVTYRTEISGPDGAELGPMITADFPETMAALVARSQS
jgi:Polyketide cyclase / dehydrase and lipid transport